MRMSLIPLPNLEGYASYIAATQMLDGSQTPEPLHLTATLGGEPHPLPALQCLKSLDDLDEEADEDDDGELADIDEEEEDDDLDDEFEDDEDEDGDEDDDEDEEDEDEDGGVKPLKMSSPRSGLLFR